MGLRDQFTEQLKAAMLGRDAPRVSILRMITARLKDIDIAARPRGIDKVADADIVAMLRAMAKSRRESIDMYRQGNRPELAAKEEAEITVIEAFLPGQMDDTAVEAAVIAAIAEAEASTIKDMGRVMAILREKYAGGMDMAKVGPLVKARLG